MAFPDGFVDEVRHTADIVRYIGDHVPLRKAGSSWKGVCPFHQEKTPSFNVRAEPPLFHCFGCGVGGDIFKFAMLHEHLSFPEAVEAIAQRFGIPVPESRPGAAKENQERRSLLEVLEAAADWYSRALWSDAGRPVRTYLEGRGFARSTLERVRAGAAKEAWSRLFDALSQRFSPQLLSRAGLILERQSGKGYYDRFRNRAIFPIPDEGGRVVAFGARSVDGSDPKYLNSPESPVYHKGRTLYGLSWAREGARREGFLVLMEGYLDVARAIEAGIPVGVATCGTALTPNHARLLHRFTERVVVNFDQDSAGQKAAQRSIDLLLEAGLKVDLVELPPGHDPDSFLREHGVEAYRERLQRAVPYTEWLIRRAAHDNDIGRPEGKAAFLNAVLPRIAQIESAVERAAWVPLLVDLGRLDEAATVAELRRAVGARRRSLAVPQRVAATTASRPLPVERLLIARILRRGEPASELVDLDDGVLEGLRTASILRALRDESRASRPPDLSALEQLLTEEDDRRVLREIALSESPAGEQSVEECVREIRRRNLKSKLEQLTRRLGTAVEGELEGLLTEKLRLTRELDGLREI